MNNLHHHQFLELIPILIRSDYKIISIFLTDDFVVHYLLEDMREGENGFVITGFDITNFLKIYQGNATETLKNQLIQTITSADAITVKFNTNIKYIIQSKA